jgi:hypothetical protein
MSLGAGISAAVVTILISSGGRERQEDLKRVSGCPGYVLLAEHF